MGLGKTLQALGLLSAMGTQAAPAGTTRQPGLVIAPASLLGNWRREAARFAPQLRTFVHHGEHRLASAAGFASHDLVITSYGTLARDQALFTAVDFATAVADEAQHIKNRRSQNAAALRALRALHAVSPHRDAARDSLEDSRSLFEFLLPGYLLKVPAGIARRGAPLVRRTTAPADRALHLRRTKQAVAPELPAKLEQTIWCELTPAQAALYRATQEKSERELLDLQAAGASEAKLQFAALTQLLRLRQILLRPAFVTPDSPAETSAKLDSFNELVAEAIDDGHRSPAFPSSPRSSPSSRRSATRGISLLPRWVHDPRAPGRPEVDRFQTSAEVPLFPPLPEGRRHRPQPHRRGHRWSTSIRGGIPPPRRRPPTARTASARRASVTSYKLIAAGTVEERSSPGGGKNANNTN
jgi:SNF2 family DNA or RNA helicase